MNIYFNEICLTEHQDPEQAIIEFRDLFASAVLKKPLVQTKVQTIYAWYNEWRSSLDFTLQSYFIDLARRFEECYDKAAVNYYYLFTHQDYGLNIDKDISLSSLAIAAHNENQGFDVAVVNLPKSVFCKRPFIPVLISPFRNKHRDVLVNLPSFNSAITASKYLLIKRNKKFFVSDEELESFLEEYFKFFQNFKVESWEPKVHKNAKRLNEVNLFPLTIVLKLKYVFDEFQIAKGSTAENIVRYKELGDFVLTLHGYLKNSKLSNHYQRDIYEAGKGNKKLLISLDLENGGLEVIDGGTGVHIAVHGYGGEYIKAYASSWEIGTHSLPDLPASMFLF